MSGGATPAVGRRRTEKPKRKLGRPIGSKSERTKAWERIGHFLLKEGSSRMEKIMRNQSDEDFVRTYLSLLKYFKPQLQSQKIEAEVTAIQPVQLVVDAGVKAALEAEADEVVTISIEAETEAPIGTPTKVVESGSKTDRTAESSG